LIFKLGVIASLLALTRPEGILFSLPVFATIALRGFSNTDYGLKNIFKSGLIFGGIVVLVYGSYVLFRLSYFNDIVPNTYYVKGGPTGASLLELITLQWKPLDKLVEFSGSIFGADFWAVALLIPLLFLGYVISKISNHIYAIIIYFFVAATGLIYMLLPLDWMGEFRFATTFYPFYYLLMVYIIFSLAEKIKNRGVRNIVTGGVFVIIIGYTFMIHGARLKDYGQKPVTGFPFIAERFGKVYNNYAKALNMNDATFLLPDIGGSLYYSNLRIYDLGGLADKTIAKTRGRDQQAFYDYVFEEIKPTFIRTHGHFTGVSKFDDDARFERDYVPFVKFIDTYVQRNYKATRISGDFIRREVIEERNIPEAEILDYLKGYKKYQPESN
jgi:hypothetical protein